MSGSVPGARVADILAELVAGTAHTGQAFFESLVLCLSRALGVRYALVGELAGGSIRTVGLSADGALQPPLEYSLAGTPCANVMTGEPCYYPARVAELFPDDALLREMGATSYLGVPLHSSTNAPIGILVVLHDAPIEPDVDPKVILQIFAGRAAAEIERLHDERELARRTAQLQRSEEMFSKVFRASPAAMTISELETGRIVDVNDAFTRSRGFVREEVVGRGSVEVGVWDDAAHRDAFLAHIQRDGAARDVVLEVPGPGGRRLMLRASAEVAEIRGRRYLVTMSENVTDRIHAELALKRSEERLRLAMDAARMGVWDWDLVARSGTWSDRENAVCGFPPGTSFHGLDDYMERVHPDDTARLRRAVDDALSGATDPYVLEYRVLQADGATYRWVESRGKVTRDSTGRPIRLTGTVADIDDRKRTDAELRASETRLRRSEEMFSKVFRTSPAPMAIARTRGRGIVDVNDAMIEATGVVREEVIGRSAVEMGFWPAEERDAFAAELIRAGRVRNIPVEFQTPRGRRSMLLAGEVVTIEDEPHFLVMTQDITERLDGERRLQQSEERWRRFSEATFEGIGIAHAGRLVDTNAQLAAMLGYDGPGDLIGRSVADLIAPESMDVVRAHIASESAEPYEHIARRKDGTRVPVEVRGRGFEAGGQKVRVTAVRDMTERRRLEADLRNAVHEWNQCFDAMPAGLVIADEAGRIRRANRLVLEWSGAASFRDLIGRTLASFGAEEPWLGLGRRVQAPGSSEAAEELRSTATGKVWRAAWSAFPRAEGEAPWIIFAIRDVTEEMRLRDDLRRQETLAAMGSLVAGVAHEVRTPLFSISATLDAVEGGTPEEVEEGTERLRAQVKRLSNLMSDLLDYGRPPALQIEDGRLGDVLERAVRACAEMAAAAGVAVRLDPGALDMPPVPRDPRRLEQVFQNLVANAVQHSSKGGTVRLVVQRASDGRTVDCRVEDEGPGIPAENLPRVFEPFFTKRKGGTGLGLPIVQRLVEAHGGRVTAANRLHGGAVFTVTLPAGEGGEESARA
jgi:PAS domain S-box-containing protein